MCSQTTATLRYAPLTLRLTAPVNGLRLTGAPGHGEHRGQRWGVLRQTQGRRTWASLGEAVFRQILQGGALRATILQRGRSQFPYPLKGGRQQSLRTVLGGGPSGPPPLLTSTSLGCSSQWRCGTGAELSTKGILGGLFRRGGTLAGPAGATREIAPPENARPTIQSIFLSTCKWTEIWAELCARQGPKALGVARNATVGKWEAPGVDVYIRQG